MYIILRKNVTYIEGEIKADENNYELRERYGERYIDRNRDEHIETNLDINRLK